MTSKICIMGHHPNSRLKVRSWVAYVSSLTRHLPNIATIPKSASSGRYECTVFQFVKILLKVCWKNHKKLKISLKKISSTAAPLGFEPSGLSIAGRLLWTTKLRGIDDNLLLRDPFTLTSKYLHIYILI